VVGPSQDLHERALAGTVLAHEGVHFAGPDAKINALENAYARKAFADLAYFQDRPIALTWSSLCTGRHFLW
jgi:hypothetical protein